MKISAFDIARQFAARHSATTGRKSFHAETVGDRGSLYIYDVIGEDFWTGGGVTARSVQQAIDGMKGAKALDIYVNSPGGDIFEAKAIFAQLRRFQGERVVYIDGIAASAATFIAMAGDRIVTAPAATWMIHEVWARGGGTAADHLALAAVLEMENKTFAETYASRTKQSVEDVLAWMAKETWMNASEALERGFTDEIAAAEVASDADKKAAKSSTLLAGLRALRGAEQNGRV